MPIDFSFLENAAPKEQEPVKMSGLADVSIRSDADCFLQCDGEYVDLPLRAGIMAKIQLPIGQHLLEFISQDSPNVKVEKVVDFPESGKKYLVIVNELKAAIAPLAPNIERQGTPFNPFLDQLNQMAQINPLESMEVPPMPMAVPPSGQDNKNNTNN